MALLDEDYHEPIWLRGVRDLSGVLEGAIQSNRIIDNAEVSVDESFSDADTQELALRFVERLGGLNGLKSLRLLPDKVHIIYEVPVRLLTIALQRARELQMFSICAVDLVGNQDEFVEFMESMRNHASLHLVRLIRCRLPNTSPPMLADFVAHVSAIPNLKEVELCGAEESSLGIMSNEALISISGAALLEKFCLDNFELTQDHFMILLQWLERRNNRLRGVSVSACEINSEGLHSLARMLRGNQTLEELSICLSHSRNQTLTDECFMAISQSLERNTSLRQFGVSGSNGWPKLSNNVQKCFLNMLRHWNYTLERLSLFDRADLQPDVNFFLATNRLGRKFLVHENCTKEEWLQAIIRSTCDLSCLYFFLSMKPELLVDQTKR
ncbi:expressed unknown protein [Seminavis robusta]|uniref:Uncharacterized protein n=1 Tax=Seminavis robusta TaxID=568900 RepID=A0A9N8DD64_9STRA|nr:expressed unknown protein [Seminavis robusta]|eukprot:Sro99_g050990.1 n/a (383) ;mRNA; r:83852-85000